MKKMLYLHGFASSGASGTVGLLRKEFWERDAAHRVTVIAPDLPIDPIEAMSLLRDVVAKERPDLVIGTSMGGMYAQQLHGIVRICVNPSFWLSKKFSILHVGKHKWLNARKDGAAEFHVTKETIAHFQEIEAHQFEGVTEEDRTLCHGLFGDSDELRTADTITVFERYYPGMAHSFQGGHRMNDVVVKNTLLPYIRNLNVFNH